jgi:hypothetical protein
MWAAIMGDFPGKGPAGGTRDFPEGQEKAPFPAALLDLVAGSAARTGNLAHVARLSKKFEGQTFRANVLPPDGERPLH